MIHVLQRLRSELGLWIGSSAETLDLTVMISQRLTVTLSARQRSLNWTQAAERYSVFDALLT